MGLTEDDKRSCCLLEIQETEAKYYRTLEDIEKVRPFLLEAQSVEGLSTRSSSFSLAVRRHPDQKELGEERSSFHPNLITVSGGNWCRTSSRNHGEKLFAGPRRLVLS